MIRRKATADCDPLCLRTSAFAPRHGYSTGKKTPGGAGTHRYSAVPVTISRTSRTKVDSFPPSRTLYMSDVYRLCALFLLGCEGYLCDSDVNSALFVLHTVFSAPAPHGHAHGVSPRDRWLCVLPRWQSNMNEARSIVNYALPSGFRRTLCIGLSASMQASACLFQHLRCEMRTALRPN